MLRFELVPSRLTMRAWQSSPVAKVEQSVKVEESATGIL